MSPVPQTATLQRPSLRRFDRETAFAFWANGGQRRSWREVAAEFGVTESAVFRAACRDGWHERADAIDVEARKAVDRKASKSVAQRITEDLQLIDASKVAYARGLQSGKVTVSASEMAQLMRIESLITGGPTERLGPETDGHARSLATIEAELAALDPAQVDALVAADAVVAERVLELDAVEVES